MGLVVGATVFAQIVSLIGTFSTERALDKIDRKQDFLAWLTANNHEELRQLLEGNSQAVASIQALLNENHEALLARLENMDGVLAQVASRIEGFGSIARAVRPGMELSEQAISILRQLDQSGESQFYEAAWCKPTEYAFMDGTNRHIEYTEERFVDDDLATLVELSLLRLDYSADGSRVFTFTRAGAALVRAINAGRSSAGKE